MKITDCKNFSEIFYYQGEWCPDRVFIYDLRSQRTYTFKQFNGIVEKTANYLLSMGVQAGDRVTVVIENSPEFCFFYFAVIRIGAIINPMPFTSHHEEILKNIQQVEPRMAFIDEKKEKEFPREKRGRIVFIPVGAERRFEATIEPMAEVVTKKIKIAENNPACLYYSSGTTAEPKGVLFSHKNMIADISSICRGFKFRPEG